MSASEHVEQVAKAIYDCFAYDGQGNKPAWVDGGNSDKQYEARRFADAAIATLSTEPVGIGLTEREVEWLEYAADHMDDDSEPEDKACAEVIRGLLQRRLAQPQRQGEDVAWQSRIKFTDGRWSGWSQEVSEEEARERCRRHNELGTEAEWRALYTQQPASQGRSAPDSVCKRHCHICEGQDHHWEDEVDEATQTVIQGCRHCDLVRPLTPPGARDGDLATFEQPASAAVARSEWEQALDLLQEADIVCREWMDMHREYVGAADHARWSYFPGVEELRERIKALAAAPEAKS